MRIQPMCTPQMPATETNDFLSPPGILKQTCKQSMLLAFFFRNIVRQRDSAEKNIMEFIN